MENVEIMPVNIHVSGASLTPAGGAIAPIPPRSGILGETIANAATVRAEIEARKRQIDEASDVSEMLTSFQIQAKNSLQELQRAPGDVDTFNKRYQDQLNVIRKTFEPKLEGMSDRGAAIFNVRAGKIHRTQTLTASAAQDKMWKDHRMAGFLKQYNDEVKLASLKDEVGALENEATLQSRNEMLFSQGVITEVAYEANKRNIPRNISQARLDHDTRVTPIATADLLKTSFARQVYPHLDDAEYIAATDKAVVQANKTIKETDRIGKELRAVNTRLFYTEADDWGRKLDSGEIDGRQYQDNVTTFAATHDINPAALEYIRDLGRKAETRGDQGAYRRIANEITMNSELYDTNEEIAAAVNGTAVNLKQYLGLITLKDRMQSVGAREWGRVFAIGKKGIGTTGSPLLDAVQRQEFMARVFEVWNTNQDNGINEPMPVIAERVVEQIQKERRGPEQLGPGGKPVDSSDPDEGLRMISSIESDPTTTPAQKMVLVDQVNAKYGLSINGDHAPRAFDALFDTHFPFGFIGNPFFLEGDQPVRGTDVFGFAKDYLFTDKFIKGRGIISRPTPEPEPEPEPNPNPNPNLLVEGQR